MQRPPPGCQAQLSSTTTRQTVSPDCPAAPPHQPCTVHHRALPERRDHHHAEEEPHPLQHHLAPELRGVCSRLVAASRLGGALHRSPPPHRSPSGQPRRDLVAAGLTPTAHRPPDARPRTTEVPPIPRGAGERTCSRATSCQGSGRSPDGMAAGNGCSTLSCDCRRVWHAWQQVG